MPYYSDLSYYYGGSSIPYSTPPPYSSFSGYARALTGYSTPTSSYGSTTTSRPNYSSRYSPNLSTISESPYGIRRGYTSLTRISSPKLSLHSSPKYIAPRPIPINTADIDVSASRYHRSRDIQTKTSPKKQDVIVYGSGSPRVSPENESPFMPRCDQNDNPHQRCTIKRDRTVVRISTMRSKSKSKSKSVEKKESPKIAKIEKSTKVNVEPLTILNDPPTSPTIKRTWRDNFGDELSPKPKESPKKSPGERLLEKHLIKHETKEEFSGTQPITTNMPNSEASVFTYENIAPSSSPPPLLLLINQPRRPSFHDICQEISSDKIESIDDLNAGELRRRASTCFDNEEVLHFPPPAVNTVTKSSSGTLHCILERRMENSDNYQLQKRKSKKIKHKITATVGVDDTIFTNNIKAVVDDDDDNDSNGACATTSVEPKSKKFNIVVEHIGEEHKIDKVLKLPKKKKKLNDGNEVETIFAKPKPIKRSELIEKHDNDDDFWASIPASRETIYYNKRRQEQEKLRKALVEQSMKEEEITEVPDSQEISQNIDEKSDKIPVKVINKNEHQKQLKINDSQKLAAVKTTTKALQENIEQNQNSAKVSKPSQIINAAATDAIQIPDQLTKNECQELLGHSSNHKVATLQSSVKTTSASMESPINASTAAPIVSKVENMSASAEDEKQTKMIISAKQDDKTNEENVVKIPHQEEFKKLTMRTSLKINNGPNAKSPAERKQHQHQSEQTVINDISISDNNEVSPGTSSHAPIIIAPKGNTPSVESQIVADEQGKKVTTKQSIGNNKAEKQENVKKTKLKSNVVKKVEKPKLETTSKKAPLTVTKQNSEDDVTAKKSIDLSTPVMITTVDDRNIDHIDSDDQLEKSDSTTMDIFKSSSGSLSKFKTVTNLNELSFDVDQADKSMAIEIGTGSSVVINETSEVKDQDIRPEKNLPNDGGSRDVSNLVPSELRIGEQGNKVVKKAIDDSISCSKVEGNSSAVTDDVTPTGSRDEENKEKSEQNENSKINGEIANSGSGSGSGNSSTNKSKKKVIRIVKKSVSKEKKKSVEQKENEGSTKENSDENIENLQGEMSKKNISGKKSDKKSGKKSGKKSDKKISGQNKKPVFNPQIRMKLSPEVKKIKFYTTDEKATKILYATPRPLQKKPPPKVVYYSSESDSDSDDDDDDDSDTTSSSGDEESSENDNFDESSKPLDKKSNICGVSKDIRLSTCSNDSGFEGGTAPSSPKQMLECDVNCHKKCEKLTANLCGVNQKLIVEALSSVRRGAHEARDSPSTPPSHNPAYKIDINYDDLETSYTYAQFQRSGRITAPATTIPRFKKYAAEDFHFLAVLGKGSFGKVLLAELRNTDYYYAVKCLKKDVVLEDDDVECTLIERKVLALGTKHPYLCHLFCTFQTESHLFFVMEYLNGGDLMFHIQQSGRFPEPRGRFYAAEIISGLKFLHKKGIVYRDLKLDNVLLDFDGHVRIADFGMCKLQIYLDRTADSFCGTPDYMAPEIIKGQKYNQTVDWWSFGVLLYEMLVGQSPFSGCDEDELFWSICNEVPWIPGYLSKEALSILKALLEKDATIRLGSVYCPLGDIMDQPFFHYINWEKLERRELESPFKPLVRHPLDTQYFDKTFTKERVRLTPIDKEILQSMDQEQFQGFSYTNPNATLN